MHTSRPKQYLPLLGQPLILHTLERLCEHPKIAGVFVGVSTNDQYWATLKKKLSRLPKVLDTFAGGAERAGTVLNGLKMLATRVGSADWVMVHDVARPCIRREDIDKLIADVHDHPDGGLLAIPVSDTVKRTDTSRIVVETVAREDLWRAVTPQLFPLEKLTVALEQALAQGVAITDEAAAVEHAGGRPRVVAGHADNIKITLAEDLALAELFLRQQEKEQT